MLVFLSQEVSIYSCMSFKNGGFVFLSKLSFATRRD